VALIRSYGGRQSLAGWTRLVLAVVFVILAAVTVRSAWMTAFINQNYASEYLIFAGGTPDTPIVAEEIERLARRFAGQGLKVAYDNESQQPFFWYLRDFPNVGFYTGDSGLPADMHVILIGDENEAKFKSQLTTRYVRRGYRLIWWPDESTYRNLTLSKLWSDLKDPARRKFWWDIFWWRKYPQSPTLWPLVSRFAMYVRRDVASQVWLSGAEVSEPSTEIPQDDYDAKRIQLSALAAWGSYGDGPGQLNNPKGIAVDGQGNVYVADSYNHRVMVFDSGGQFLRQWGGQGNAAGQFQEPWGIAVDAQGMVYVADTWNHRIQKFDAQGGFLTQWGSFGDTVGALADPYTFYGPRQIAVDPDGDLLVSDTGNKRLLKFTADGDFIQQVGGAGSSANQYLEPVGLAVDAKGNVYVADTWNQRIQKLDADLSYVAQWPVLGWESQLPSNKPCLAVDSAGNVYATGPDYHWVVKFDVSGKVSAVWGQFGSDMSSMNVPSGIAVDTEGQVYVLDSGNHRVLKFAPVP
jgi:DNA-binding beta-propeller fold protein YncE